MTQPTKLGGNQLLALLLLGVLLVNFSSAKRVETQNVQDPLPTLILSDDEPAVSGKEKEQAPEVPLDGPVAPGEVIPSKPQAETDPKLHLDPSSASTDPSSTTLSVGSPVETESSVRKKPDASQASDPLLEATREPTSQSNEQPSETNTVKDINTLLANKNDAENDVVASSTPTAVVTTTVSSSSDSKTSLAIDLDAPVDTNKPVDDRFHYSFGNNHEKPISKDEFGASSEVPAATEKSPEKEKQVPEEDKRTIIKEVAAETTASVPLDKAHDSVPTTVANEAAESSKSEVPKVETTTSESTAESALDGKSIVTVDDKTKSIVIESPAKDETITSKKIPAGEKEDSQKPLVSESEAQAPVSTSTTSTSTTTTTTTPASSEPGSKTTSSQDKIGPISEPKGQTTEAPRSTTTEKSTTPVAVNGGAAPSIALDTALGSAAGSALGTVLTSKKTKEEPKVAGQPGLVGSPGNPVSTSTTKVPARKSTTDRWNRWSPTPVTSSSTTLTPPYRRRPILPSIRRRFRPHTRFSPFPWGGADSYSPFGGNYPDYEGENYPSSISNSGRPSTSSPTAGTKSSKRRVGSSTTTTIGSSSGSTTEPSSKLPSSSTSSSGSPKKPSRWDSEDDELSDQSPTYSSRRRIPGPEGGRRQHQNHNNHHHHHNNHHHHRHRDHENESSHRRRHHQTNPSTFGSGFDLSGGQDPLSSSSSSSPFGRPNGFGLFNSGSSGSGLGSSTGSGFDLLNPFSWLDEVTRPRPSRPGLESRPPLGAGGAPSHIGSAGRPPGHRPIPVEGEFNSGPADVGNEARPQHHHRDHDHHNHGHGHGHGGRRPVSGGHERDDYDDYHDHHGHDCHHDHDHDHHHHQHRPHRPHREPFDDRPPVGGDYDTYPPNSSGYSGSRPRPNRPYHNNRRDQTNEGSSSTSGSAHGASSSAESESSSSDGEAYPFGSPSSASSRPSSSERINGHKPEGGPPVAGPRRVSSAFSPFDSLFGSLDDDLFGGLRSSFIDSPLKAAAEANAAAFDAVISSPKLMMPPTELGGANQSVAGSRQLKPAGALSAKLEKDNLTEGKSLADGMKEEDIASTLNDETGIRPSSGGSHRNERESSEKLDDGKKPSLVRLLRLFVF